MKCYIILIIWLDAVTRKFQRVCLSDRNKRGLINLLGNAILVISENLDQEDAVKYDNVITALQKNQETIIQKLNQHMLMTIDLIHNFNKMTTLISHNQEVIAREINKINTDFQKFVFDFNLLNKKKLNGY